MLSFYYNSLSEMWATMASSSSPWKWPMQNKSLTSIYPLIIHTDRKRYTYSFRDSYHLLLPLCCRVRKSDKQVTIVKVSVKSQTETKKKENLKYKWVLLWRWIVYPSKKLRSILLINLITLLYASNIPVLKEVESVVDPAAFTAVRFSVAAIPFLPSVWRARGDFQTFKSGTELGLWASLGYLMQALGLLTSDAGRASFIAMFTVIVVPLIDGMLGAVIPARTWFGALVSIIGVGLLECSGSPPCVGDLLSFLSALFFGIHMLKTERISRKTDKEDFLAVLGYEVCVVALSSLLWYFIGNAINSSPEHHPLSWTWKMFLEWIVEFPWIPALYTSVFTTSLCLWIEMAAMRDVSATEAAIIYGLEPEWGAGFAWFLLGERWGVTGWFGAALVLGGSLTVQIVGASSPASSDCSIKEKDIALVSDTQKGVSVSPVPINTGKDVSVK